MTQPLLAYSCFSYSALYASLPALKGRNRTQVVGSEALVVTVRRAIPLGVGYRNDRLVDCELLAVHTEAMTVGIWVVKRWN